MKILFAVSNEKISQSIIKKYENLYKEIVSSKNVYYFNAILKELGKDKSYDRIVISEDLEPFSNKNYELTDNVIFEKLDKISDEAVDNAGEDIPIILIASDRHSKGDPILNKLFGIGLYSALLGQDRTVQNLCELINKPRTKREGKIYYKINANDVDYKAESEDNVSEVEIQNILSHYKKLGKNEEKYVESFDKIAGQYTDQQLKIIVKFLPLGVKAVLEANSPKYQQIATFSGENESLRKQKPYSSSQINPKTNKPRSTGQAIVDNGIKIESIESKETKKPTKPVIIPATMSTKNVKKIKKSPKEESQNINNSERNVTNENVNNEGLEKMNMEEINQEPKKGRGRPKKILTPEEIEAIKARQKRGRGRPKKIQTPQEEVVSIENVEENNNLIDNDTDVDLNSIDENISLPGFQEEETVNNELDNEVLNTNEIEDDSITDAEEAKQVEEKSNISNESNDKTNTNQDIDLDFDEFSFDDFDLDDDSDPKPIEKVPDTTANEENKNADESDLGDLIIDNSEKDIDEIIDTDDGEEKEINKEQKDIPAGNDNNIKPTIEDQDDDDFMLDFDFDEDNSNFQGYQNETSLKPKEQNTQDNGSKNSDDDDDFMLDFDEPTMPGVEETERQLSKHQQNYEFSNNNNNDDDEDELIQNTKPSYEDIYMDDVEDVVTTDTPEFENSSNNRQMTNINNSSEESIESVLSSDQKIVAFVGTTKNGTSFLVNNLADMFSRQGIKTAILDLTKNKNSYYIYTKNEESLRKKAIDSINRLANGMVDGVPVNKNLDVYTSLPGEATDALDQYEKVLRTLAKEYALVLIDCDFNTNYGFIREAQELYLVQSMDVLTIQPLTAYLRDLKAKNVLNQEKLRIVINKSTRVRSVTEKTIIGGMAFYNDPSMSFMTELFDREKIQYAAIPFDPQTYSKYLEGLVNCNISTDEYSKDFLGYLRRLGNMVYPLIPNNSGNSNSINKYNNNTNFNKYETRDTFSNDVNNTLNKMKQKF